MDIAAEPIQLGYDNRALAPLCLGERRGQLRAAIKGVGAFAALNFDMLAGKLQAFSLGESANSLALRLKAEAGSSTCGGAISPYTSTFFKASISWVSGVSAMAPIYGR